MWSWWIAFRSRRRTSPYRETKARSLEMLSTSALSMGRESDLCARRSPTPGVRSRPSVIVGMAPPLINAMTLHTSVKACCAGLRARAHRQECVMLWETGPMKMPTSSCAEKSDRPLGTQLHLLVAAFLAACRVCTRLPLCWGTTVFL